MAIACIPIFGIIINTKNHLELNKTISKMFSITSKMKEMQRTFSSNQNFNTIWQQFKPLNTQFIENAEKAVILTGKGIDYALCGVISTALLITTSTVVLYNLHFFGLLILSCHLITSSCFLSLYSHQILANIKKRPMQEIVAILYKNPIQSFFKKKNFHKSASAPLLNPTNNNTL